MRDGQESMAVHRASGTGAEPRATPAMSDPISCGHFSQRPMHPPANENCLAAHGVPNGTHFRWELNETSARSTRPSPRIGGVEISSGRLAASARKAPCPRPLCKASPHPARSPHSKSPPIELTLAPEGVFATQTRQLALALLPSCSPVPSGKRLRHRRPLASSSADRSVEYSRRSPSP